MWKLFIALTGLSALILAAFSQQVRAQEAIETNPYIYYYSREFNAFVVEQANGSNTSLWLENLLPEDTTHASITWSPSGEWFALRGYNCTYHICVGNFFEIMNLEGRQLQSTQSLTEVERVIWSSDDLLFLAKRTEKPADSGNYRMYLVSTATDRILASFEQAFDAETAGAQGLQLEQWSPDGGFFAFHQYQYRWLEPIGYWQEAVALRTDGNIITRRTREASPVPPISPDNRLAYLAEEAPQLILETVDTGEQVQWAIPEGLVAHFDWNMKDGKGYFIVTSGCEEAHVTCPWDYWSIDIQNGDLEKVAADLFNEPDQWRQSPVHKVAVWSPDQTRLLWINDSGDYYLYNLETHTSESIALPTDATESSFLLWEWFNNNLLVSQFFWDQSSSTDASFFLYDLSSQRITKRQTGTRGHQLAPDASAMVVVYTHPTIVNLETGAEIQVSAHSARSAGAFTYGDADWHSESEWVLIGEAVATAGGGGGPQAPSIIRVDGEYRREFPINTAIYWFPDSIDPYQLSNLSQPIPPRPLLQPLASIKTTDRWYNLMWSPDGKWLAGDRGDNIYWRIQWHQMWNMETYQAETIELPEDEHNQSLQWELGSDGEYLPLVVPITSRQPVPLAFTSDHRRFVAMEDDCEYGIFDAASRELISKLENLRGCRYAFSFSPDGEFLAYVCRSCYVGIMDADDFEPLFELPIYGNSVAFSPDGTQLAISSGWYIDLYSTEAIFQFQE